VVVVEGRRGVRSLLAALRAHTDEAAV
jgi:hypothetical protein